MKAIFLLLILFPSSLLTLKRINISEYYDIGLGFVEYLCKNKTKGKNDSECYKAMEEGKSNITDIVNECLNAIGVEGKNREISSLHLAIKIGAVDGIFKGCNVVEIPKVVGKYLTVNSSEIFDFDVDKFPSNETLAFLSKVEDIFFDFLQKKLVDVGKGFGELIYNFTGFKVN